MTRVRNDSTNGRMRDDDVWAAIDLQRRRTADLLAGLSEEQWDHPSLCEGWTVRDVSAHLTLQQIGVGQALLSVLRHPGGVNRNIRESARDRARRPADCLVAGIRATVGSRRHNVGLTNLETLTDILVHGQDIAVPLGLELEMPPEAAVTAAEHVRSSTGTVKARVFRRLPLEGFRFSATDVSWAAGEGPEIRGPIAALLPLLTGRRDGLDRLTGDGAEKLRRQLAPACVLRPGVPSDRGERHDRRGREVDVVEAVSAMPWGTRTDGLQVPVLGVPRVRP